MKKESFEEYVDRVSRARHVMMSIYQNYEYFRGVSTGYERAAEFTVLKNNTHSRIMRDNLEDLSQFAGRLAIREKTLAMVVQDRILTYREDEV